MANEVEEFFKEHPDLREHKERRERFDGESVLDLDGSRIPDDAEPWPPWQSRTIHQRKLSVRVERAMERMRPAQALLLMQYFYEGLSQADLAREYGVTQQAISSRLRTARKSFAKAWLGLQGGHLVDDEKI